MPFRQAFGLRPSRPKAQGRPPDFLVIGHVVQDLVPDGWRLGGTAAYASLLAAGWGLRAALLTACGPDLDLAFHLPEVEISCARGGQTTRFENIYGGGQRIQYVRSRGLTLTADMLPRAWRQTPLVLLGPVIGEVDPELSECFPHALLGISVQGWLRAVGSDGRVRPVPPRAVQETLLRRAGVLFVSDEDLASEEVEAALTTWSSRVPTLCFTRGEVGADVCHQGEWRHIDAFPVQAQDPTGAGDVFAAAFLIRLHEEGDPWEAARFASCAASFVVEGEGIANLARRQQIEARLAAHPEIMPHPLL